MWYLYASPAPTPGTNPRHTPLAPVTSSGWAPGRQSLNVPITDTDSALGAQTAKAVPATPSRWAAWAPKCWYIRNWVPSPNRYRSCSVSSGPRAGGDAVRWPAIVNAPAAAGAGSR